MCMLLFCHSSELFDNKLPIDYVLDKTVSSHRFCGDLHVRLRRERRARIAMWTLARLTFPWLHQSRPPDVLSTAHAHWPVSVWRPIVGISVSNGQLTHISADPSNNETTCGARHCVPYATYFIHFFVSQRCQCQPLRAQSRLILPPCTAAMSVRRSSIVVVVAVVVACIASSTSTERRKYSSKRSFVFVPSSNARPTDAENDGALLVNEYVCVRAARVWLPGRSTADVRTDGRTDGCRPNERASIEPFWSPTCDDRLEFYERQRPPGDAARHYTPYRNVARFTVFIAKESNSRGRTLARRRN